MTPIGNDTEDGHGVFYIVSVDVMHKFARAGYSHNIKPVSKRRASRS